jgi:DNA ligase D-like protein (predicted 3'-phosphoesterase)
MARGRTKKGLAPYRSRRDLGKTPEPSEEGTRPKLAKAGSPLFVIQQHRARTEHYDFRLEVEGVLRSWALPKGPSTDPAEKRLAVATEDHPVDYADFEGSIPEDEYGGGTVIVWDAGPYRNLSTDDNDGDLPLSEALERGQAEVWLEGTKVRGGYALVHSKMRGDEKNWLMVKMKDDEADARRNPVSTEPESVLSGRTIEEVAEKASGEEKGG